MSMQRYTMEVEQRSGGWQAVISGSGTSKEIVQRLKALKMKYPNHRLRAVNDDGEIIDMIF